MLKVTFKIRFEKGRYHSRNFYQISIDRFNSMFEVNHLLAVNHNWEILKIEKE